VRPRCRKTHRRALSLALLACIASAPATAFARAGDEPSAAPSAVSPIAAYVAEASRRFGIPERWVWAVMRVESRGDVGAVSPAGARGLMQIMPGTWIELRARYGLGSDPFDPRDNVLAGTAYLRELHDRYGNPAAMLAAYNAGPGRYDEHLSTGRPLPRDTRVYVAMLAPMVGGVQAGRPVGAPADGPAWTHAPLFSARAPQTVGATEPAPEQPGDDQLAAPQLAPEAPADRLFVPLSGSKRS